MNPKTEDFEHEYFFERFQINKQKAKYEHKKFFVSEIQMKKTVQNYAI